MPVVFQTGIPAEQLWGWPAGSPWNRAELQRDPSAPGADARDCGVENALSSAPGPGPSPGSIPAWPKCYKQGSTAPSIWHDFE